MTRNNTILSLTDIDYKTTVENQRLAASPKHSVWVSANAGSGKTRVLTNRVARLLLAGVEPSKILCITYTKAAAAEMVNRLFNLLGKWALQDNDTLSKTIAELEGTSTGSKPIIKEEELSRARRLFARALETPGGLKIQTIHAFCDHVLKRFPLEAGVPPGFKIAEDAQTRTLIETAIEKTVIDARPEKPENIEISKAIHHLADHLGATTLKKLLIDFCTHRQKFKSILNHYQNIDTIINNLRDSLKIDENLSLQELIDNHLAKIPNDDLHYYIEGLSVGGKKAQDRVQDLKGVLELEGMARFDALAHIFLTKERQMQKSMTDTKVRKEFPELDNKIKTSQDIIYQLDQELITRRIFENSKYFFKLSTQLLTEFEYLKTSNGLLDFDDLITHTQSLFTKADGSARWIMYKLDQGLDHILLDETQDTSPGQWDVIEGPLGEFFSGLDEKNYDQYGNNRTFFAVGDQKQSIYSFQGADASLFTNKSLEIGKKISAVSQFQNLPLTLSFRSASPVLNFVDAVFSSPDVMEGLGETQSLHHGIFHKNLPGLVELWPLTPQPDHHEPNPWDAPIDAMEKINPLKTLCDEIAAKINILLNDKGSKTSPGDIIILVQRRGSLFRQIIKSLTNANIPVAGADRLQLLDDITVQDLLSYGRCVLLPEDDLSLAEVLKSPLFGLDDDDLFTLGYARKHSLWYELTHRYKEKDKWQRAFENITYARTIGLKSGPFAMYTHILESNFALSKNIYQSGKAQFQARLGSGCLDAIHAFMQQILDFEHDNPRSLQSFITWFEKNAAEIKRELDRDQNHVRIMTVHGAKGLEAKIIFLLDAHDKPTRKKTGPIYYIPPSQDQSSPPLPILVKSKTEDNQYSSKARDHEKKMMFEEYRRLFYVAATRAEQQLYICGIDTSKSSSTTKKTKPTPDDGEAYNKLSWHELATAGFKRLMESQAIKQDIALSWTDDLVKIENPALQTHAFRFFKTGEDIQNDTKEKQEADHRSRDSHKNTLNADDENWLFEDCKPERPLERLSPSTFAQQYELMNEDGSDAIHSAHSFKPLIEPVGFSPIAKHDPYLRGQVLHKLLEYLPDIAIKHRDQIAEHIFDRHAPDLDHKLRTKWKQEIYTILDDPHFQNVFTPNSRAEVSLAGYFSDSGKNTLITGQIDRLIVEKNQILVVDYKSNQPPPIDEKGVPTAYLAQMASYRALIQEIYPGKPVRTALLWTFGPHLMPLSDEILNHAFARYARAS